MSGRDLFPETPAETLVGVYKDLKHFSRECATQNITSVFSPSLTSQTLSDESLATQDYSSPSAVVQKERVYVASFEQLIKGTNSTSP